MDKSLHILWYGTILIILSLSLYICISISFFLSSFHRRLGSFNLNWIHLWSRLSGLRVAFIVHSLLFCARWYTFLILNAIKQLMKCATACILICMTIHHARWFAHREKRKLHIFRGLLLLAVIKLMNAFKTEIQPRHTHTNYFQPVFWRIFCIKRKPEICSSPIYYQTLSRKSDILCRR